MRATPEPRPSPFISKRPGSLRGERGLGRNPFQRASAARKHRQGALNLTRREKLLALALLLLSLTACAAGGWLGMHYHHHGEYVHDPE